MLWGLFLIVYGIYLVMFNRVRIFDALRKPISHQIREASALTKHYLLGKPLPEDVAKNLERHNVLVAYMTILLFIGVVLLSASGVLMVYRDVLGLSLNDFRLLLLMHDLGFYLSLIFVLLHLFASLHPSNRPLLVAMFGYGKVSLEWVQKHMPRFLSRVQRG